MSQINSINLKNVIVPDKIVVNMKVSEAFSIQNTAGVGSFYLIANSLYNPGATNFNAQPAGFDQWMAFYAKYRVLHSRLNLEMVNNSDSTVNGIWVVIYPTVVSTTLSGSVATATSQPYSAKTFMGNIAGNNTCSVSRSISSNKMFGKNIRYDEGYSGDFGSSPSYKFYWLINSYGVGSDDANIQLLLTMTFQAEFYARLDLVLSAPS